MRPFRSIIPLDEARRRLAAAASPISRVERVPLREASGRVASADVRSAIDVPPFSRSAMDGYAVIAADTAGAGRKAPAKLRLVDRIHTGRPSAVTVAPGQCAEIATGAPIPAGADAVVMVEETSGAGDTIAIFAAASAGQHISPRAADIAAGALVVGGGHVLTPAGVGALAAIGCADVEVYARPRVAILSTGNEVIEPGRPLEAGQIYDVNRFSLSAIVAGHGGAPEPHAPVGDRDLILDAVQRRGRMIFHGIAVKPGKPTAFALLSGTPLFGMPGNPTSCLSNAYILLIPFLRALARLPPFEPRRIALPLAKRVTGVGKRLTFYTVRIENGKAWPAFKGSGDITSLSLADGYIEIPPDTASVEVGTTVEVTLF
jgi:molybdopterin molybdotransferase